MVNLRKSSKEGTTKSLNLIFKIRKRGGQPDCDRERKCPVVSTSIALLVMELLLLYLAPPSTASNHSK